jgi:hypothetical protein
MEEGAVRRMHEPLPIGAGRPNYTVVEEVELPDPMLGQLCVDVLFVAEVVLEAAAEVLELLAVPVVEVEFVWADANPTEAIPAIAETIATTMRE